MYELIIIGIGPAGLAASIYASRFRIKHLLIGKELGGAMALASLVENYPGFEKISGLELAEKMANQARNLGGEIIADEIIKIEKKNNSFLLETALGKNFEAKAIIVATGTRRRKLNVPGENEYLGKGVSYCSTCDAAFFKNKVVAVIGGANAAAMGAVHLSEFAQKVYLIYRGENLRAEPIWVERIMGNPKIEVIYKTNVEEILGDGTKVNAVNLDNPYKGNRNLAVDGVFIEIGGVPGIDLVKPLGVKIDEKGFIKVDFDMSTNIPGVFAAGDVASSAGELQQIVTAVSEGAIAATSVYRYLRQIAS
jgi:thioredoxin reductase (NADPH)